MLNLTALLRYSGVDGSGGSEFFRFSMMKFLKTFRMQANHACLAIIWYFSPSEHWRHNPSYLRLLLSFDCPVLEPGGNLPIMCTDVWNGDDCTTVYEELLLLVFFGDLFLPYSFPCFLLHDLDFFLSLGLQLVDTQHLIHSAK